MVHLRSFLELQAGERAKAICYIPNTLAIFDTHFPRFPILPGVLILDSLADLAIQLLQEQTGDLWRLLNVEQVRFRHFVLPGDQMQLEVEVKKVEANNARLSGKVLVNGQCMTTVRHICLEVYQGIHSILIEKRKTPTDLNRGDGMQPRSLEIMEQWGLLSAFEQAGAIPAYGIEMYHPFLGKLLEIDLGEVQTPHPHLLNLPHREIEILLLEYAQKSGYCQIYYGNVNDILFEGERAIGVKAVVDGRPIEVRAPVVAGADGAQSVLRRKAGIDVTFQEYDHDLLVFHAKKPAWFTGKPRTRVYLHREGAVILLPLPEDRVRMAVLAPSGMGGQLKTLTEDALLQNLARRYAPLASLEGIERHGEHIYRMRRMHTPSYTSRCTVISASLLRVSLSRLLYGSCMCSGQMTRFAHYV